MTNSADREKDSRLAAASAQVRDAAGHAKEATTQAVGTAVERVSDVVATAKESAGAAYSTTLEKAEAAYSTTREKASEAYASASQKAADAYAAARERASAAGKATSDGVQDYPAIAIIGALAVGAVTAALLPRSAREAALLAPVGARIGDAIRLAANAAKEAGIDALGEAGINRDSARTQVDKLLDTALGAAKAAGGAAAEAVRKPA